MSDSNSWVQWLAQAVAEIVRSRFCHPAATYRLQFGHGQMTFRDAAGIVPYLDELGISHLYASPYLKARTGSPNGYAIVDYAQLNPELGGVAEYRKMVEVLHSRSMGQILDVVPNHMSAAPAENLWWNDVLENGPAALHATYFDIDWRPIQEELRNKVLLPILGNQYGQVLESGDLKLEYREGSFVLRYFQSILPIEPRSYRDVLTPGLDAFKESQPADSEDVRELESIVTALEHLPDLTETEPGRISERQREKEVIKGRLRALTERVAAVTEFIGRNVREFNGTPEDLHSYDRLDKLLDAQAYRLSHWKAAADEINYRRFFDINELAAVCMEAPDVFAESHRLVFDLLVSGDVDGLRIDHIDGLYEPIEYLRRLQKGFLLAAGKALYQRATGAAGRSQNAPAGTPPPWSDVESAFLPMVTEMTCTERALLPLYVLVEKVLGSNETLAEDWLLAGTTGYDFLNSVAGLFVDPAGVVELENIYSRFIDLRFDFREVAQQSKLLILRAAMSSDLQLLAQRLNRISLRHRRSRDFTLNTLRTALRDIVACFPVYRTYIREGYVSECDRQVVYRAVAQAKRRNPATDAAVFDFIRDVLLLERPIDLDGAGRHERELFVGRVQQVTSPVMAKGIEDTAYYRYFPLASLNEVGGNPIRGATSIEDFHRHNLARQAAWPRSLNCTTTHDTKRSEDARARINVLSEVPRLWRKAVNHWARLNHRHHREVAGQTAPSRNDEYLFYQSLLGIWPLAPAGGKALHELADRMAAYMEKATREAKIHTSWINPDVEYDAAVREFVATVLDAHPKNRFLAEFRRFSDQVVNWGLYSALSQTVLKLTSPGVPDIYQGQECWDFSLVDPDNRRPVDFAHNRKLLARLRKDVGHKEQSLLIVARQLAENPRDSRLKLFVVWRTLQFRRQQGDLFNFGEYIPLAPSGRQAEHVCAFARQCATSQGTGRKTAIVIAPCRIAEATPLQTGLPASPPPIGTAVWEDTFVTVDNLTSAILKNVFTGQVSAIENSRISLATALADFPVALFTVL
jgi:(1->4)-alpha-D-glucan 1-alpha-D-glucosylmutase